VNVELVPLGLEAATQLAADPAAFAVRAGVDFGPNAEVARDVATQTVAHVGRTGDSAPWGGYIAVSGPGRLVVGTCAFVAPPAEGMVEIAYFTFPGGEGRGVATTMARALLDIARAAPEVRTVRAHTLPADGPSPRILEKLAFERVGDAEDADAGRVWRWERGAT